MKVKIAGFAAICAVVLQGGIPAFAQTVSSTPSQVQAPSLEDQAANVQKVAIVTRAKQSQSLIANQVAPVELSLVEVPGAASDLTRDVTATGFVRYVEHGGQKIGQIILTGIRKGEKVESLNPNDFSGQFTMEEPQLGNETMTVEGDGAELLSALQRLAEEGEVVPEIAEQPETARQEPEQRSVGSDRGSNEQAQSYSTPSPVEVAEASDPVESFRVTTEGCDIHIDLAQQVANVQSRLEHSIDGAVQDSGTCADGQTEYPLEKSYSVCSDLINLEARTATAQFVWYYIDGGGARKEVNECAPDAEKVFQIEEKQESCSIYLDFVNEQAVPQSALVYLNDSNAEQLVRSCEASETKAAAAMTLTTTLCGIRHEFDLDRSVQEHVYTYELEETVFQAGSCFDSGIVYSHEDVFVDSANQNICGTIVDQDAGTATRQFRTRITVNQVEQYITECTPDATTLAVLETEEGCTNPDGWEHDLAAGISYGSSRFYYVEATKRKYITDCQSNEDTWAHQVETVGWQNFDATKDALPLTTVYITPPSGRYNITTSTVQAGALRVVYTYDTTEERENGINEYSGCDVIRGTDKVEVYKRPDGTDYEIKIGDGNPVGPLDVCSTVIQTPVWAVSSQTLTCSRNGIAYPHGYGPWLTADNKYIRSCYYRGQRILQREDGEQITQNSVNEVFGHSTSGRNVPSQMYCGHPSLYKGNPHLSSIYFTAPDCQNPFAGSAQIQWNQNEGW